MINLCIDAIIIIHSIKELITEKLITPTLCKVFWSTRLISVKKFMPVLKAGMTQDWKRVYRPKWLNVKSWWLAGPEWKVCRILDGLFNKFGVNKYYDPEDGCLSWLTTWGPFDLSFYGYRFVCSYTVWFRGDIWFSIYPNGKDRDYRD